MSKCPYDFDLSDEEADALDWLYKTMLAISSKDGHCNKKRADLVLEVVGRAFVQGKMMHDVIHELQTGPMPMEEKRVLN